MSNARFSIIPAWIVTDARLKGNDLKVLCLLGSFTNAEGWCRRSQVKMADELGCGRSTVQASLNRLYDIGVVEKREAESRDGRDSAHYYRVIHDRAASTDAIGAWHSAAYQEFVPSADGDHAAPPASIMAGGAGSEVAPPATSGQAPINDTSLTNNLNERERARARGDLGDESPKSLERRFRAWFAQMPGYLDDAEDKARKEWLALTPKQRLECEAKTPVWLAARKNIGRTKAVAASTVLKERRWERLEEKDMPSARGAGAVDERVPVAPFGPVWAGLRQLAFFAGPVEVEIPDDLRSHLENTFTVLRRTSETRAMNYITNKRVALGPDGSLIFPDDFEVMERRRRIMDAGYPEVLRLHRLATDRARDTADPLYAPLAHLCEAVPVGSDLFEAWRALHDEMGWLWIPDPGRMPVVYFPKGGPEGLEDFRLATLDMTGANHDAA